MNYEADRAMNQKRLRMEGEGGHGIQGNGLPLNYMDNGHQIAYQPYAYNTHYPPPEAFSAYGPPPPGSYAPQNLSYAPPAHQNYTQHHQSFPPQQSQQLHMGQPHMGYGVEHGPHSIHKSGWPQHILSSHEPHKPLEVKPKQEVKLEPTEHQKRPHSQEREPQGELEQPKIKIKTDIFKPDEVQQAQQHRIEAEKPHDNPTNQTPVPTEAQNKPDETKPEAIPPTNTPDVKPIAKSEEKEPQIPVPPGGAVLTSPSEVKTPVMGNSENKPESISQIKPPGILGLEPKKRGRPKVQLPKPRTPVSTGGPRMPTPSTVSPAKSTTPSTPRAQLGRPKGSTYQYAMRPFRKDFSGIQFRRRWSDDCLDSSHIPNEVYFGDVPVSMEILFNYYDANVEREKLAAQAVSLAAQKQQQAKLVAAKLQARGLLNNEQVTTVDSSSDDTSSGSEDSDSSESDDDVPLKKRRSSTNSGGKRGRPPVPPELRPPSITDLKKFLKAAGIRFEYKKMVEEYKKHKERSEKMLQMLADAGVEGKPTLEKCRELKAAIDAKKAEEKKKKSDKKKPATKKSVEDDTPAERRMTRGATGVKPRQKIVISSDEEDDTPNARKTISKLRSLVKEED